MNRTRKCKIGGCLLLSLLLSACGSNSSDALIQQSLERQMHWYPCSTLQDLYKNFFQDRFGPGHIINDTASAAAYLQEELVASDSMDGFWYEPTGYLGHFYRVNLSVVKDGLVDYQSYLDAFIRSVNGIEPMSVDDWKKEWKKIDAVIAKNYPDLLNYAQDKARIDSLLQSGKYVMHHSRVFNDIYHPHYRIISKEIFEAEILPQIEKNKEGLSQELLQGDPHYDFY